MGREFQKLALTQEAIVALLEESPLPWTNAMLVSWFGRIDSQLTAALSFRRVRRLGRSLYTSDSKYESPVVTVTSAMIYKLTGVKC